MSEAQDIEEDEVVKPTLSKCTFENGDIKLEDDEALLFVSQSDFHIFVDDVKDSATGKMVVTSKYLYWIGTDNSGYRLSWPSVTMTAQCDPTEDYTMPTLMCIVNETPEDDSVEEDDQDLCTYLRFAGTDDDAVQTIFDAIVAAGDMGAYGEQDNEDEDEDGGNYDDDDGYDPDEHNREVDQIGGEVDEELSSAKK